MCERDAVTPDVSCTTGRQSTTTLVTTTVSHQCTVKLCWAAQYSMVSDYICKLWRCRG